MLVAQYDSNDAYLSEKDYEELDEETKEYASIGYDEDLDSTYFSDFKYEVEQIFSKKKFPLILIARASNWRGQDGYSKVNTVEKILSKIFSFSNDSMKLHRTRGSALHFKTASHDVPTGFIIEVKPYKSYSKHIKE